MKKLICVLLLVGICFSLVACSEPATIIEYVEVPVEVPVEVEKIVEVPIEVVIEKEIIVEIEKECEHNYLPIGQLLGMKYYSNFGYDESIMDAYCCAQCGNISTLTSDKICLHSFTKIKQNNYASLFNTYWRYNIVQCENCKKVSQYEIDKMIEATYAKQYVTEYGKQDMFTLDVGQKLANLAIGGYGAYVDGVSQMWGECDGKVGRGVFVVKNKNNSNPYVTDNGDIIWASTISHGFVTGTIEAVVEIDTKIYIILSEDTTFISWSAL
jgi:hypothetical protein